MPGAGSSRSARREAIVANVARSVPIFPLNTVLLPGMTVPLHVFEERYVELVRHLLRIDDPSARFFGSVGIREGYEVGDHGGQSLHRTGNLLQLTEVEENPDGTFDVVAISRSRMRLDDVDATEAWLTGTVVALAEDDDTPSREVMEKATATYEAYRQLLEDRNGVTVITDPLPFDPAHLSWTMAAGCLLTMIQRQELLETDSASERLSLLTAMIRAEMRVMQVMPSLPAIELARTQWSPN